MLHSKIERLNDMETSILHFIQHQEKVKYDKDNLQTQCDIKSKIWVTRSVNRLIQLGFIKESTQKSSDFPFLTLTQPATKLPPIVLASKSSIPPQTTLQLTKEQETLLSHLYHLTQDGCQSTPYCLNEMAEQLKTGKEAILGRDGIESSIVGALILF